MTKNPQKITERNLFSLIKNIYIKPIINIMLLGKDNVFPLKLGTRQVSTLTTNIQHTPGGSRQCNKARKVNKMHTGQTGRNKNCS